MKQINILIIEDDINKFNLIKSVVEDIKDIKCYIEHAIGYIEGKSKLADKIYDLLILDIIIPLRFGDQPLKDNGINLFKDIFRRTNTTIKIPKYTISLTADLSIVSNQSNIFHENNITILHYEEYSQNWKNQLTRLVFQTWDISIQNEDAELKYIYDYCIICALENPELEQVLGLPFDWVKYHVIGDFQTYYEGKININGKIKRIIASSASEMGIASSSILATKMINRFKPEYLIMTGIAAAVKNQGVLLGDIMLADPSFNYESGKYIENCGETEFFPDYRQQRIDVDIITKVKDITRNKVYLKEIYNNFNGKKPENIPKIITGPFATGSAVVSSDSIIKSVISNQRKIIGIDMETYGVMLSAYESVKPKPKVFSIKSACDFADSSKNDDYQTYASYTSAQILYKFILDD